MAAHQTPPGGGPQGAGLQGGAAARPPAMGEPGAIPHAAAAAPGDGEEGVALDASDPELQRAAARLSLWQALGRSSRQLIYSIVMRSGGEPFGAPFELGLQSLTEKVVRRFSQHSFFAFEALERMEGRGRRNKFTRHGAAPFRGAYRHLQQGAVGGPRRGGLLGRLAWRRRR